MGWKEEENDQEEVCVCVWCDTHREYEYAYPMIYSLKACNCKAEARSLEFNLGVPHEPAIWVIIAAYQGLYWQKPGVRSQSQVLIVGTPMCGKSDLATNPTAQSMKMMF